MRIQLGQASVNPPDLKWGGGLQAQVRGVHAGLTQLYHG